MKTMLALLTLKRLSVCGWLVTCAMAATALGAQTPAPRIRTAISSSEFTAIPGSQHPRALVQYDAGRMPGDTKLNSITIVFSRSAAQQADLEALIAAQQNPASPLYHQWLTPDQFAARFGMAQSDLDKAQTWLEQQGFSVDSVARSRNLIRFSGNVGQVEQAFQTQMHFYNEEGARHFAPATALSVPAALAPIVLAVRNLDDFRPRPMHIPSRAGRATPAFTSSVSGNVFLAPGDVKIAYDMNPLLGSAYNGTGQSIALMGQSSIVLSDIEAFESAAGLTVKDPTLVLVPNTGSPQAFSGDEGESDLDLEWSGGIATGAQIFFVYTGSNTNYGVFDSMQYAVDEKIGNIISLSYGSCEAGSPASSFASLEAVLQQAATQGQTVIAASGDEGSTACYVSPTTTNPTLAVQEEVSVSYPASSEYVTGVGGTEVTSANDTAGSSYWSAEGSTDTLTSLIQYIPEVAWNDDLASVNAGGGLSATGGGASTLYTSKPTWQTGVAGIPNDNKRDVPDVSLYASPDLPGYLYCTSDQSDWNTTVQPVQTGSCGSGFRASSSDNSLTVAGGTSFAAPIFAGMVAILNQKKAYTAGQGLINPTLYSLASNGATYAAAFHDVTTGNNECPSSLGSSYCTGSATTSFSAGTGYDLVTGLGSVDLNILATAWGASPVNPAQIATITTVSASSTTPALNASDTFTITVTSADGTTTIPTGTVVTLQIDGGGNSSYGTGTTTTVTLTASNTPGTATATYQTSFSTAGAHQVVAQFPSSATFAASTGVASVTVPGTSTGTGTFSMTATGITVSQGSQGSTSITVTPAGGYKGTINIAPTSSNVSFCYSNTSAVVSSTAAATATMTIDTNLVDCGGDSTGTGGKHLYIANSSRAQLAPPSHSSIATAAFGLAGVFLAGLLGWRRKTRFLACLIVLGLGGFVLSGCGSSTSSSSTSLTPKGTYTITLNGQDSSTSTITASTTFTLTVQ